jgi:hypothetical protein
VRIVSVVPIPTLSENGPHRSYHDASVSIYNPPSRQGPSTVIGRVSPRDDNTKAGVPPPRSDPGRARRRVENERLRVQRRQAQLQKLRRDKDRLVEERNRKVADCKRDKKLAGDRSRSELMKGYLALVGEAEQLYGANEELTKEIERRQLFSAAVDTRLSNTPSKMCIASDARDMHDILSAVVVLTKESIPTDGV